MDYDKLIRNLDSFMESNSSNLYPVLMEDARDAIVQLQARVAEMAETCAHWRSMCERSNDELAAVRRLLKEAADEMRGLRQCAGLVNDIDAALAGEKRDV